MAACIRDFIGHLHRRESGKAGALAGELSALLEAQRSSGNQGRVELTIAAIGEARMLLAEDDYGAAAAAARDAAKEWRTFSTRETS